MPLKQKLLDNHVIFELVLQSSSFPVRKLQCTYYNTFTAFEVDAVRLHENVIRYENSEADNFLSAEVICCAVAKSF